MPVTSAPLAYRPQLDGLRAAAVAAVAWSHWEPTRQFGIPFGVGVHLFYVLSGFLITGILLQVRASAGRMAPLVAFYTRRALRIFPAFYLTLALAWWADVPPVRDTLAWHLSYLSNVQIVMTQKWPGAVSHFWSLAVEEQFYLVWPGLIVFAPRRWLMPAVVAAIATAPLFRWWLASRGYHETLIGVLTPGSLDSLGVGALTALWTAGVNSRPTGDNTASLSRGFRRATVVAAIGWIGLLILEGAGLELPFPVMAAKQTLQAIVFAWVVLRASEGFRGLAGRLLSAAPVVYVGRISYGAYLAHGFAGAMLAGIGLSTTTLAEPWRFMALAGVTVAAAALSWHCYEGPINAVKRFVPYARLTRVEAHGPDRSAQRQSPVAGSPRLQR